MTNFAQAILATTIVVLSAGAQAGETALRLKDGPEAVLVRARCSICHSIDYVQMNAGFMKRAGWEAEVHKMMKAMGAPVPEEEVARIVDYLTRNYGVE